MTSVFSVRKVLKIALMKILMKMFVTNAMCLKITNHPHIDLEQCSMRIGLAFANPRY